MNNIFDWLFEKRGLPTITLIVLLCAFVYIGAGLLIAFAPEIKEFTQNFDRWLLGQPLIAFLK
ncbi:MAG TPA: hypothetical protein PLY95_03430 [Candidatus Paceibacterota bacterium]|nr:hypothetical protein [Smithellaceae bacterium]HQI26268.1 hypothetical protein [Candidatus Paceibacterota bacterium]